jgi:hypothetical protein
MLQTPFAEPFITPSISRSKNRLFFRFEGDSNQVLAMKKASFSYEEAVISATRAYG